jgi:hypothetical protein
MIWMRWICLGVLVFMGCGDVSSRPDGGGTGGGGDGGGGGGGDGNTVCEDGWRGPECDQCVTFVDGEAGDDGRTGLSWGQARATLQAGMELAAARVEADDAETCAVWIAAGTYLPGAAREDSFTLLPGVHLYGGFAGVEVELESRDWTANPTVLSGDIDGNDDPEDPTTTEGNAVHVVVGATGAVLDGFTVTAGRGDVGSMSGGGMYILNASPVIANVEFVGNAAWWGAGISNEGNGAPVLTDVTFRANRTLIAGGSASGMYTNGTTQPVLHNVRFIDNRGSFGAGFAAHDDSQVTIVNGLFVGNVASRGGAALYAGDSSDIEITNATVHGNTAQEASSVSGGGLAVAAAETTVRIRNSIFWGNVGAIEPEIWFGEAGGHVEVMNSIVQGGRPAEVAVPDWVASLGEDLEEHNPRFVEPPENLHVQASSPAVDAGNSELSELLDVDLEGNARIRGDAVDMGAYERP